MTTPLPAPTLFRKKPVVIEAVQIEKRMDQTSPAWWAEAIQKNQVILHGMGKWSRDLPIVEIETLEGTMTGVQGDWIIRGVKGELYPCKPDIFAATYEPATAQDDTLARTGNTTDHQAGWYAGIDHGWAEARAGAQDDAKDEPPAMFGDEAHVSIPIGLIGAACSAIEKKRDAPKTLAELRRYTFGGLSRPAPAAGDAQRRAEMYRLERNHERAKNERLIAVLVGIHNLTLPAPIEVDGKTYAFTPPEAVEFLRALSDRIRAIPGEIAASQQQEG